MQCRFTEQVSSLVDDELDSSDAARLCAHIEGCADCRNAEIEFRLLRREIKSCAAPTDVAARHRTLNKIIAPADARRGARRYRRGLLRPGFAAAGAAALLLLLLTTASILFIRQPSVAPDASFAEADSADRFWEVERTAGAPRVGATGIGASGRLVVGESLETDGASRARVGVANIGHVEVDPNSRLRLVETNETEHRLSLERGKIHALIYAPPRLFFVNTPSAVAVDYGCAYTLEVDDRGGSLLHVTAGWVALEAAGRESFVPAGNACATAPGKPPGTPYYKASSQKFRDALTEFDFGSGELKTGALAVVLDEARPRDALTLWHLLSRTEGAAREHVYTRLAELSPPPAGVTRDGVLRLDEKMLDLWKESSGAARYEAPA